MSLSAIVLFAVHYLGDNVSNHITDNMYAYAGADLVHVDDPIINDYVESALF